MRSEAAFLLQADEAGLEKEKPPLETVAADGIVAIVAASDTTASTLSSLVWFLLSKPECYRRVQQELDSVITDGDDSFDVNKHQELQFLSACMSVSFISLFTLQFTFIPETRHYVFTLPCPRMEVPDKSPSIIVGETLQEGSVLCKKIRTTQDYCDQIYS